MHGWTDTYFLDNPKSITAEGTNVKIKFIILALLALTAVGMASAEDVEFNESDPLYWYDKALLLLGSEDYAESVSCLDKTIELETNLSKFSDILYHKGLALRLLGKYDEAIPVYDRAIELDPQDVNNWYYKGLSLLKSGKYEESIKIFDKAIKLEQYPDSRRSYNTWYHKGLALKALGRNSEAKAAFSKAKYTLPAWMEFVTFSRGEGFDAILILYNDADVVIGCDGQLRVELYSDRNYKEKVWSRSVDVERDDFESWTWGFGREANAWHLKRIPFDDIKPGLEYPVYLYVRAYFDSPDGSILKDTTMV